MRLEDYERKVFEEFSGLYSRGELDQVPQDHFSDCLNIDYDIGEWKTRPGLRTHITLGYGGKVRRFVSFADPLLGPIILILDDNGNLYTYSARSGDNATTPRLTITNASDFSAIKMLGKVYIAFHDGEFGLFGENLKVFIPGADPSLDEFRDAAGPAPISSSPMVAVDGAGGIVNAGVYKIAVSFITSSGFTTQPGPKNFIGTFTPTTYTSPGSVKINLSDIPIGPAGTVKRQILITKADLEEYFFLPEIFGGLIVDNVATTAILDFDDTTDLVDSADDLFDLLETIPAPLALQDYDARLTTGGEAINSSILRVSKPGEPEAFDAIDGIVNIQKDDGFTIRNILNVRNTLYVWKNLGVYSVHGNEDVPSSWPKPNPVDQTVNTGIHGIAEFFDISGIRISRDWTLVVDRSGIVLFDGIVRKPPITDKINNIWQSINFDHYHKIVIAVDEQLHKIYCAIPVDGAVDNNKLLVGDYNSCPGKIPSNDSIKWSIWQFKPLGSVKNPTEIGLFGFPPDTVPILKVGSVDGDGRIWSINPSAPYDDGTEIESFFKTSSLFWEPGFVHFFTAARLRVVGSGTILCSIQGLDDVLSADLPSIVLSSIDFGTTLGFVIDPSSGSIDGSNVNFTLGQTPSNFLALFHNGLLVRNGVDFTLTGSIVTMTNPPQVGDTLKFFYRIGSSSLFNLETPTGTINGSNATFNLSATPSDAYVAGFLNGLLLKNTVDFTIAGAVITMITIPQTGDTLQFLYHADLVETGFVLATPTGTINGTNVTFTKVGTNVVTVFLNGVMLSYPTDFTLSGTSIIFTNPPQVGDTIQYLCCVNYATVLTYLGQERLIRFNFQNEKARIKFRLLAGKFIVSKLECFGKPVYSMRPS